MGAFSTLRQANAAALERFRRIRAEAGLSEEDVKRNPPGNAEIVCQEIGSHRRLFLRLSWDELTDLRLSVEVSVTQLALNVVRPSLTDAQYAEELQSFEEEAATLTRKRKRSGEDR